MQIHQITTFIKFLLVDISEKAALCRNVSNKLIDEGCNLMSLYRYLEVFTCVNISFALPV